MSFEGYSSDLLFKEASRPFAWRTACKREFLLGNRIVFDETVKYGEDQVFDFAVYGRSRKTALISNKLYDYRVARKGSLMDTMRYDDETRLLEHVKIYSAVLAGGAVMGSMPSMPMTWRTSCVIWCCTMHSGSWARAAARCSLPLPRRLTVLPWAVMPRLRNAILLLPPWCARHLPAGP